jgi:hypothetical protein
MISFDRGDRTAGGAYNPAQHTTAATARHRHGFARSMRVVPSLRHVEQCRQFGDGRASQSQAGTGFRARAGKSVGLFPDLRPGHPVGWPALSGDHPLS